MANWHYMVNDEENGPVSESELLQLKQGGIINENTQVRQENGDNWDTLISSLDLPAPQTLSAKAGGDEDCALCNKHLPSSEMMQYEGKWICADCKPQFEIRLKEGDNLEIDDYTIASIGKRFGAIVIDGLVFLVLNLITSAITVALASSTGKGIIVAQVVNMLGSFVLPLIYEVVFIGLKGATPGKMAMGVKVISTDGEPVSMLKSLGRYFAKMISGLILMIGYIMAFSDKKKQALHDKMCNTLVVLSK
ncbi:MAG: RDD family protein [Fibrobacteria bacterium]|nr:RDD family protein [Fibrobacteria bacterium]